MPSAISSNVPSAFSFANVFPQEWSSALSSPLFVRPNQNFGQHTSIERALGARRLVEREMPMNDDSLFHAFADQLAQRGMTHFVDITLDPPSSQPIPTTPRGLRDLAIRHLSSMKAELKEFFTKEEFETFDHSIKEASTSNGPSKPIDDFLAFALAKALDVDVVVCQDKYQHSLNQKVTAGGQHTLVVTYRKSNDHYNSTQPEEGSVTPHMTSYPRTGYTPPPPKSTKPQAPVIKQRASQAQSELGASDAQATRSLPVKTPKPQAPRTPQARAFSAKTSKAQAPRAPMANKAPASKRPAFAKKANKARAWRLPTPAVFARKVRSLITETLNIGVLAMFKEWAIRGSRSR